MSRLWLFELDSAGSGCGRLVGVFNTGSINGVKFAEQMSNFSLRPVLRS
jgi:hypothetical protein